MFLTRLRRWVSLAAMFPFLLVCSFTGIGAEHPNPLHLLQGVEAARQQIPPSRLKMQLGYRDSLVTNDMIVSVEFDGARRGFSFRPHEDQSINERVYQTVFDGERAICYDEKLEQVTYRRLGDSNGMKLFDPRIIGISTYNLWQDSIENTLLIRYEKAQVTLVGRENVDDLPAWHVHVTLPAEGGVFDVDYWIDETKGFRVYRKDFNGVQTLSHYENNDYPWLPSRVEVKEYREGKLIAEREVRILEGHAAAFPKERWTLAGMQIKPMTDVVDWNLSRSIGMWDGKQLVPTFNDVEQKRQDQSKVWIYILGSLVLVGPLLIFWHSRHRRKEDTIS